MPRQRIQAMLAGEGAAPVAKATGLGAASSSCSYAAIAIAKSLFQKGASASPRSRSSSPRPTSCGSSASCSGSDRLAVHPRRVRRRHRDDRADGGHGAGSSYRAASRSARASTRVGPRRATGIEPEPLADQVSWRERVASARRLVRRRAELPLRLADALEGDHARVLARRVHRPAGRRLLQLPLPRGRASGGFRPSGGADRSGDRGAQLRLLGRQRAAGGRAMVGRHLASPG